jgi:hypothetical protein
VHLVDRFAVPYFPSILATSSSILW